MPQSTHEETTMTETETRALMERHGISATQQTVYHHKGCRYGNLADAVAYAELSTNRESAARQSENPVME
jgi:hypothetical protein